MGFHPVEKLHRKYVPVTLKQPTLTREKDRIDTIILSPSPVAISFPLSFQKTATVTQKNGTRNKKRRKRERDRQREKERQRETTKEESAYIYI